MVNPVVSYCINSTALNSTIEKIRCVTTGAVETCRTTADSFITNCPNGCNTDIWPNVCNPTGFESNLLFLGIVLIIVIGLAVVAKKYG